MTDAADIPNPELVSRFAALVTLAVEQPAAGTELRDAARRVAEAAKQGAVSFTFSDGALLANGAPCDAPVLGARLAAYGVEEIGVTPRASQADLFDLARLLAAPPGDGDPVARFASRAAVLDAKAIPRRLRALRDAPVVPEPLVPAPPPRRSSTQTPAMTLDVTPPASRAVTPPNMPAVAPSDRPPIAAAEPRDAPVRLARALDIPETSNAALAEAMGALQGADDSRKRSQALDQMVSLCDLAFRQGRHDDLVEAIAALLAIEYRQLEADGSDEQRQAYNHAVRRLARPTLLRQLAIMRHRRAADAVAVERLQQALFRFGVDGVEAMLDACAGAADPTAVAACLDSLRDLPRTHETLLVQLAAPDEFVVRQAVAILGALGGGASVAALADLIDHPDPRTRRDAVAGLVHAEGEAAFEAVARALSDESPLVRLRAVTGLRARRDPRLLALLEPLLAAEPDREVLYAAVDAIGAIGTAEAVPVLIQVAQGLGTHPQRDTAGLRIQACIALVAIRTPQAMAAVQVLRDDRSREVRQASMRLVAHAKRRQTTQANAVIAP